MDASKPLGGIQPRLFKRIATIILAFALSAGIIFGLFTYAPEKYLQHMSNAVGISFGTRPIPRCGDFAGSNEIWKESQTKYRNLRDDKFTYGLAYLHTKFAPILSNHVFLVSQCKHIVDPKS